MKNILTIACVAILLTATSCKAQDNQRQPPVEEVQEKGIREAYLRARSLPQEQAACRT